MTNPITLGPCAALLYLVFMFASGTLSAQQENGFQLSVKGGVNYILPQYPITGANYLGTIDPLADEFDDRWTMTGYQFGVDGRWAPASMIIVSAGLDYTFAESRYVSRVSQNLETGRQDLLESNSYRAVIPSIGVYLRPTSPNSRFDWQFGLKYTYSFVEYDYANIARLVVDGEAASVSTLNTEQNFSQFGLGLVNRFAIRIYRGWGLLLDAEAGFSSQREERSLLTANAQLGVFYNFGGRRSTNE